MAKREGSGTRGNELYEQLRAEIFTGRLSPGQRLKLPELCAKYETSPGVTRKALTRLVAERLVQVQAHQGYAVAALSESALKEVTDARLEIKPLTFRQAIRDGDAR